MKLFALTICFYLNVLTVLPTVRAFKMAYGENCKASCGMNNSGDEIPNGCQKEKCLLNFNFNSITFLMFQSEFQLPKEFSTASKKEKTIYHQNLIPHFSVTIWQPPEGKC